MYVIVMIMIQMGQHKIASDQILYPNMEMCEVSRADLVDRLMATKPSGESFVFSKCT
jgi:hypothetical protein